MHIKKGDKIHNVTEAGDVVSATLWRYIVGCFIWCSHLDAIAMLLQIITFRAQLIGFYGSNKICTYINEAEGLVAATPMGVLHIVKYRNDT